MLDFLGLWWVKPLGIVLGIVSLVGLGGYLAHRHDMVEYNRLQQEYTAFVQHTKTLGEAAQKAADTQKKTDEQRKRVADEDLKNARAAHADAMRGWLQLAQSRASAGYLPPTPAAAGGSPAADPDHITFSRAVLERALGELDAAVSGLAGEGDTALIDLAVARRWAAGNGGPPPTKPVP